MSEIKLTTKQRNKINRAIKSLNNVRSELQQENVDLYINWYLEDSSNLNLMSGDSHSDDCETQQRNVIEMWHLDHASGGGW